jgi:signal-transduction protein with cAMP-binding, CBS, and nucleotidyltransferase domain
MAGAEQWSRQEKAVRQAAARQRLLAEIETTQDYAGLRRVEASLTDLEMRWFLAAGSVPALQRRCTGFRNRLAARTVELVEKEMLGLGAGPAAVSFALISMGSDGRQEQSLITDQDYLIVYDDGGGEPADDYFQKFSELLVARLAEVGFRPCTGDIMPSNPTWRGSLQQWRRRLLAIVRYEYEAYARNLMDLIVLSDARFVAGDQTIGTALVGLIREFEHNYFQVILGMARAATEMKVGLKMFGRLWTDRKGEHKGKLNLKLLGWAPLVMNVRILAVSRGIPATNTLERITALEKVGSLSPAAAGALRDAYHLLTRHRILLQVRCLEGGQADSYFLDPNLLSTAEREDLRRSLATIRELQQVLRTNFVIL